MEQKKALERAWEAKKMQLEKHERDVQNHIAGLFDIVLGLRRGKQEPPCSLVPLLTDTRTETVSESAGSAAT